MTMTKESLRQAREVIPINDPDWRWDLPLGDVLTAAGFVERLLPEECLHPREATQVVGDDNLWSLGCSDCHGTGQIWDEGLVEVVAKAIYAYDNYPTMPWDQQLDSFRDTFRQIARAVLSALGQEVSK